MSKASFIAVLLCFLHVSAVGAAGLSTETIQLTKPDDIRTASTMDRAIVMLSDKVMQCAQNKAAPASECFCLYPRELSRVAKPASGLGGQDRLICEGRQNICCLVRWTKTAT
jgi:hypothetical protein